MYKDQLAVINGAFETGSISKESALNQLVLIPIFKNMQELIDQNYFEFLQNPLCFK
ncbi:MAG: hypothetical protein NTV32_07155 [Gammaproteobacteria bacterium]|nr:hypothetical protein [Gammaproteobacteria bacterium]